MSIRHYAFIVFCIGIGSVPLAAQTTAQTAFGKNRVQYHRQFDEWLQYETNHLICYWYGDARAVAEVALQIAEADFAYLQQALEHQPTEKVEMLVFTDLSDVKQSNIGESDIFQLRAGETKVIGNKIFGYFDGDHNRLRIQIREGIAGVLLNGLLYGSNLQEIVQNAVLLNLPPWFTEGLVAYCGEAWSVDLDNQLRDLLETGHYAQFDRLAKQYPRLAGHAFWHYIVLHYGRGALNNLLYLTRINRSVDAGFLYVLGGGYKRTTQGMLTYYEKRYKQEAAGFEKKAGKPLALRNPRRHPITQAKLSPDGKRLAYATNDIGRWRVWEIDLRSGKRRRIARGGQRNALQTTDYNYPLLAWSPDNRRLAMIYEKRDVVYRAFVETDREKIKTLRRPLAPEYQRIYSMDFINANDLVFSAAVRGYSDLFIYRSVTNQSERITHDFWDDLDASFAVLNGRRGVLFASNRWSDTLATVRFDTIMPLGQFDLFWYDLEKKDRELLRLTHTPWANERAPAWADSLRFVYLSDESGVINRKVGKMVEYPAFYTQVVYLRDGAEVTTLDVRKAGEWPLEKAEAFYAPLDSVLPQLDTAQIDSIIGRTVWRTRAVSLHQTNYDRNLTLLHASPRTGQVLEGCIRSGRPQLYKQAWDPEHSVKPLLTRYREGAYRLMGISLSQLSFANQRSQPPGGPVPPSAEAPAPSAAQAVELVRIDTLPPGWFFQVPVRFQESSPPAPPPSVALGKPAILVPDTSGREEGDTPLNAAQYLVRPFLSAITGLGPFRSPIFFNSLRIIPYRLKFRTDYISTTVDNNLLFEGLESFAGTPGAFRTPPPGILMKGNFKDILEDHVIEAGFRMPTTFNGMEYYMWYDNKKRRIDRRIALYRRTQLSTVEQGGISFTPASQSRVNTLLGQYELRYPFDPFLSLRGTATLRQDKTIRLSTNRAALETPEYNEQRAALRMSLVYDNTVDVDMNIKTGTRARIMAEMVKRFDFNTEPEWSLRFNSGWMTVLGLDARHYIPLDKRSILAFRLAGAATFGSERILYFLGGVDNWLIPQFNNNIPVPDNPDFAFRTLAANLRGFRQNIRNGSHFALLNAEVRVPIFKYIMQRPVLGNFWRNFQLVGFFDTGSAWQPARYVGEDNPLNTQIFVNPPTVVMKVNYFRDPLVAGYGVGLRSMVFGMYMRLDYAWGIETRVVQKPMAHIALGVDF